MAGIYSRAVGQSRKLEEEKGKVLSESGQKKLQTEEKVYDVEKDFATKTQNALSDAGWLKTAGSIIGGGIAMATGVGPLMAAMYAATGTAAGSVAGKHQINQAFKGMKWKKGSQDTIQKGYDKDAAMSIMQSAIMAGTSASAGAGTMEGVDATAKAADLGTKANLETISKIEGIGKTVGKGGDMFDPTKINWEDVSKTEGFDVLDKATQKELMSNVKQMRIEGGVDPSWARNPMGKDFDMGQAKRNISSGLFGGSKTIKGVSLKSILEDEEEAV